jgi:hypothetical protein
MDFVNESKAAAGWTLGFEPDGRELVVVAIKATYAIPGDGNEPQLANEQVQLTEADVFSGVPGLSAPIYESDYAHRKPFCDVLVNGSAYAPIGKPVRQVRVGVKVGAMAKTFSVVGNRLWQVHGADVSVSAPEPFDAMSISYDNAFGGVDESNADQHETKTYLPNPVGRGFSHFIKGLDGKPLPNTEEPGRSIADPKGSYAPMSFGSVGRNWQPRAQFAGTYDQEWLDDHAPFWPADFDYRYFQAGPEDQQIPYPSGGEEVVLTNLTPDGNVRFNIPVRLMPVLFIPHRGRDIQVEAKIDTILIEPDMGRFAVTWRVGYPLRKSCFDLMRVVAGKTSREWFGRQRFGKPYYGNLAEMARARRR